MPDPKYHIRDGYTYVRGYVRRNRRTPSGGGQEIFFLMLLGFTLLAIYFMGPILLSLGWCILVLVTLVLVARNLLNHKGLKGLLVLLSLEVLAIIGYWCLLVYYPTPGRLVSGSLLVGLGFWAYLKIR